MCWGNTSSYKLYAVQIQMESELSNDIVVNATQAEQNFRQGRITVDVYILAQRAKNEEMVKIMNLQLQQDLVKLDIERMIGMPLESACARIRQPQMAASKRIKHHIYTCQAADISKVLMDCGRWPSCSY